MFSMFTKRSREMRENKKKHSFIHWNGPNGLNGINELKPIDVNRIVLKSDTNCIQFTVNGELFKVNGDTVPIDTSLNSFLRNEANLKGTKFMCLEGGCGVCIVTLKGVHPVTGETRTWATNSCLTPIYAVHGLDVITVEGIGNSKSGYHAVQKRLTDFNGTQCGYCSPGMVMNMYSLLESHGGQIIMAEIENSFGGNICRCTGYRPILDAFKSFAVDASEKLRATCQDIEDLSKTCSKTGKICAGSCHKSPVSPVSMTFSDNKQWHKVFDVESIFQILNNTDKPYMLVAGNTAHGVYRRDRNIDVYIDINGVRELHTHTIGNLIVLGASLNLTETMSVLNIAAAKRGFEYCKYLSKHIDLIANVPVRNAGTIAGNLSIKHAHHEFPSDLFLLLEAVGANLTIATEIGRTISVTLAEYLTINMNGKILINIVLPPLDVEIFKFRSYKIMPRSQNAHAYVNAAFLLKFKGSKVEQARICFGGINDTFIHATDTESFLVGKDLYQNDVIRETVQHLSQEINPDYVLPDATPEYRKKLAIALFYKFILNTSPAGLVRPEYLSGANILERSLSSGTQTFDVYEENFPLTKPVPKYEGPVQCSGEAIYMNDLPFIKKQLWAAFVPATKIHATIESFDASDVLKMAGVHQFISAKDIPGENNFYLQQMAFESPEEILIGPNSEVQFYGQPAGIILADSNELANYAARHVKIKYNLNGNKLIVPTMKDAFDLKPASDDRFHDTPFSFKGTKYGENATKNLTGRFEIGGQYHYTMEPQTTLCVPNENELDVYCSTQFMDFVQVAISKCIQIPENKINMYVRRVGGGYGGKITRATQVACACALASHLTNRTVRFVLSLESNMEIIGKRYATTNEYDVDVDDDGVIQKLKNNYAEDFGCSLNESTQFLSTETFKNCYRFEAWDVKSQAVVTNAASNTWCRAPGSTEGIAMIENIMEHIAFATGKDSVDVRLANLKADSAFHEIIPNFLRDIDYYQRKTEINEFNQANRWIKRGIAISLMEYPQEFFGGFSVFIAIYNADGTVAISHGGIEMGQGVNTKVAQVVAFTLGIPLDTISVKRSDNLIGANATVSGGSLTSEVVCYAAIKCCEILLERLKPVRDQMPDATWAQIVAASHRRTIDLTASYMANSGTFEHYPIWGISSAEIEVDVLTGNIQLRRVDILEDTGESMSPLVDVGQVEGAFIMGVGYWLNETLIHSRNTGELLTNRTWNYKPPGAKDIPVDFRVTFLQKSSNPVGVLRSKATGEPALCMSIVCIFALRQALNSARKDAGLPDTYYHLGAPSTPETIFLQAGNSIDQFIL